VAQKRDSAPWILCAAFVLLVLALNLRLFTQPIVEFSDYAANSLLVQQAKHFTLLTGHYSRWQFHHPGPAFLYLFALGEFLFYDVLHIVPAPYNGQLLITILFNGALLAASLHIIRRHVKLSVPLALLATTVVMILVNTTRYYGGDATIMVHNWMPDVMLFPYLLLAVSAASVLAGSTRDLPWLAFSGMLLIHAHFAQFLFVGVIGGGTLALILYRPWREKRLSAYIWERRRELALSAAIVFLFALPPLLELLLDRPNNLDALLAYRQRVAQLSNNLGMAIGYTACLFLFIDPISGLAKGPLGILAAGFSRPVVMAYWLLMMVVFVVVVIRRRKTATADGNAPFLWRLAGVIGVSMVLFLYWGARIAGGMFAFNGVFAYSLQMLAWFILLAEIQPLLSGRMVRASSVGACVILAGLVLTERGAFNAWLESPPGILQAARAMPTAPFGKLAFTFQQDDWAWAVSIANSMQRLGKPFCVVPGWGFMFSRRNVCPEMLLADKLQVTSRQATCTAPCRLVYQSGRFSVSRYPAEPPLTIPIETGVEMSPDEDISGFNEAEGPFRWLEKRAAIRFRLAPQLPPAPCFRIALNGFAYPGRPTQLGINGRTLGTLSKSEPDTALFVVPRDALRPGAVNTISLDTEKAGPVGGDLREIGFGFVDLRLRAAYPGEACKVEPNGQPEYFSINAEWAPSCYAPEGAALQEWRWCGPDSLVVLHNSSTVAQGVALSADFSTGYDQAASLTIRSPFFTDDLTVSRRKLPYARTFAVPPGDHTIVFTCKAPRVTAANDPRNLVLRIENFSLKPAPDVLTASQPSAVTRRPSDAKSE